jgi:hypothetical protein
MLFAVAALARLATTANREIFNLCREIILIMCAAALLPAHHD